MGRRSCCISTCRDKSKQTSFHDLPTRMKRRREWLNNISSFMVGKQKMQSPSTICNLHFEDDCFRMTNSGKRILKQNAIPTIFEGFNTVKNTYKTSSDGPLSKKLKPNNELVKDVLLEDDLQEWCKDQTSSITASALQKKVKEFALDLDMKTTDLDCSIDWIQSFCNRHENVLDKTTLWLITIWPDIRKEYSDDEIYNAVAFTSQFGFSSHRTLVAAHETCPQIRGDFSIERLTILLASNITGTDKLKPVVVGKALESHQCFKSVENLPVDYIHNPKGSINGNLLKEIIKSWDDNFYEENKKVLLLLDKNSSQLITNNLKAIEIVFLPFDIKSPLMNNKKKSESVATSLKDKVRKLEIQKFLDDIDNINTPTQMNIAEICCLISTVWDEIPKSIILKSFINAGFIINTQMEQEGEENLNEKQQDSREELAGHVSPLKVFVNENDDNDLNLINLVDIKKEGEEDVNALFITENEITSEVFIKSENIEIDSEFNSEHSEQPSLEDASSAIQTVKKYFMFSQDFCDDDKTKSAISHLESLIQTKLLNTM